MKPNSSRAAFAAALAIAVCAVGPASAQLVFVDIFKNTLYQQTSGAAPTNPAGYFFDADAQVASPLQFDSASVTYPGPASPQAIPLGGSVQFDFGSPLVSSLATFNADYPTGTYTVGVANSSTHATASASMNDSVDAYTVDIPALTAATFAKLPTMNVALNQTIDFNSFTPNTLTTPGASATFLTFDKLSTNSAFTYVLAPGTTSFDLPPFSLQRGQTYMWELDFSDRISGLDGAVSTLQGFDVRTEGVFTTSSAPEPATWTMLIVGVAMIGLAARRRCEGTALVA